MRMQSVIQAIYPPQCVSCGTLTSSDMGLCGPCWRDSGFIGGLACDLCGTPLPGQDPGEAVHCDDCLKIARPWAQGRAAMVYQGNSRRMILALKHGDRTELARPAGLWLARAARPIVTPDMIAVPVPLHWTRLLRRRFNQAGLLAQSAAAELGIDCLPDALVRPHRTRPLEGHSRDARFAALTDAIRVHPRRAARLQGRSVLLVDDVMTSGATLAAATEALHAAGAARVCVALLARVAKDL